jgi:hypothetical protein
MSVLIRKICYHPSTARRIGLCREATRASLPSPKQEGMASLKTHPQLFGSFKNRNISFRDRHHHNLPCPSHQLSSSRHVEVTRFLSNPTCLGVLSDKSWGSGGKAPDKDHTCLSAL